MQNRREWLDVTNEDHSLQTGLRAKQGLTHNLTVFPCLCNTMDLSKSNISENILGMTAQHPMDLGGNQKNSIYCAKDEDVKPYSKGLD